MSNKAKKKSSNKPATKIQQKKTNFLPFLTVAAAAICAIVVFWVKGNGDTDRKKSGAVTITAGESLVIPTADITADASFYPVEVDGTDMEVVAVRDSAGNIRTAFNTCQICYDSERGYYVQSGNDLVCQNCGNRFSMDQVEIESGGCNPWPIFDENKTVTADGISISYDFLVEAQGIFANWKGSY
ncbi:MAG: DUF2318 domain-containing protein [Lachnospiraceae bacterium]|nr:DUF2318 domain-containing protein [Lachnospiraceae bacterium]